MGGLGEKDLHKIQIDESFVKLKPVYKKDTPKDLIPKSLTGFVMFGGTVRESETQTLEAVLKIKNLLSPSENTEEYKTDSKGNFSIPLKKGGDYAITIDTKGYLFQSINLNLNRPIVDKSFKLDVKLSKPKQGQKMVLKNVFFDTGKSTLTPKSTHELDQLIQFLQLNDKLVIEISGHTDNVGNADKNKTLSRNRAKAVYDYLVSHGIPVRQLKYAGYGSERPITSNKTEYGRQKKRRTEFEVISVI